MKLAMVAISDFDERHYSGSDSILRHVRNRGSTRLETLPNEGISLEDQPVVWMLDLVSENLSRRQD